MMKFPIDPTPYVILYVFIFFILPFSVLSKNQIKYVYKLYFSERDEVLEKIVKKWFFITLISWVIGFFLLGLVLFILESNNLLINHSKGLYGFFFEISRINKNEIQKDLKVQSRDGPANLILL